MSILIDFIMSNINKLRRVKYLRKFNKNQIKEIKLGMVENLNIKYYAKEYFDEYQMREIRYGLEEGLDVGCYAKKYYNSNQMREIRLSLEVDYDNYI